LLKERPSGSGRSGLPHSGSVSAFNASPLASNMSRSFSVGVNAVSIFAGDAGGDVDTAALNV
jgi:hypothetical protein